MKKGSVFVGICGSRNGHPTVRRHRGEIFAAVYSVYQTDANVGVFLRTDGTLRERTLAEAQDYRFTILLGKPVGDIERVATYLQLAAPCLERALGEQKDIGNARIHVSRKICRPLVSYLEDRLHRMFRGVDVRVRGHGMYSRNVFDDNDMPALHITLILFKAYLRAGSFRGVPFEALTDSTEYGDSFVGPPLSVPDGFRREVEKYARAWTANGPPPKYRNRAPKVITVH
jgi:hypothetical protein